MTNLFAPVTELITGLITGIVFGFLLQKAKVTNPKVIKRQLILKDFTVMKVILTAIATGSIALYAIKAITGNTELIISTTTLKAALIGGGVFGTGMAMLGLCPGTCVGALADKNKAAMLGFLGMILGAMVYKWSYVWVTQHLKPSCEINKTTLAQYLNISPWLIIISLGLVVLGMMYFDRKKGSL